MRELEDVLTKLAKLYDQMAQLREIETVLQKSIKETEAAAQALLGQLPEGTTVSIPSPTAQRCYKFSLRRKSVVTARNWDEVYDFIRQTGDCLVLQRRLNTTYVNDLRKTRDLPWAMDLTLPYVSHRSSPLL